MDKYSFKLLTRLEINKITNYLYCSDTKNFTSLTPHRQLHTYKCELNNGEVIILKRAKIDDWVNQKIAFKLRLGAPRVSVRYLAHKNDYIWFGQEFIKGKELQELAPYKNNRVMWRVFCGAIDLLIKIQWALDDFEDIKQQTLHCVTCQKELRNNLDTRIEQRIIPAFQLDEKLKAKIKLIESINTQSIASSLEESAENLILVRWDYKPDNLLWDKKNYRIYSIDWRGVARGSRWVDLAFLLADLPPKSRKGFFDYYLNAAGLKENRAISSEKFENALKLIQIIHISSNAKEILGDRKNNTDNYLRNIHRHLEILEKL